MSDYTPGERYEAGTPERVLSERLDSEGFGRWVNPDEIVAEVIKAGWSPASASAEHAAEIAENYLLDYCGDSHDIATAIRASAPTSSGSPSGGES